MGQLRDHLHVKSGAIHAAMQQRDECIHALQLQLHAAGVNQGGDGTVPVLISDAAEAHSCQQMGFATPVSSPRRSGGASTLAQRVAAERAVKKAKHACGRWIGARRDSVDLCMT